MENNFQYCYDQRMFKERLQHSNSKIYSPSTGTVSNLGIISYALEGRLIFTGPGSIL